jgi:lysophospholipase L1-like esterase
MKKVLFLGDSITDSHRLWLPEYEGLGDGYVHLLSNAPSLNSEPVKWINKGHDGLTLPSLLRNLSRDCFPYEPDYLSILIGVNDVAVAHYTDQPFLPETFALQYEHLIAELSAHCSGKILCMAPFLFPYPSEYELWLPDIRKIEQVLERLSQTGSFHYLPLQSYFLKQAEHLGYEKLTIDGVHLTHLGHELLASRWREAFLL